MSSEYFETLFGQVPLMGIFRRRGLATTLKIAEAAWEAGVRVVEVPVMTREDLEVLEALSRAAADRDLEVGAGTIISVDQLEAAARAGAAFTVAPGLDSEVVKASISRGLPHLPGVATGTEVQAALKLGLTWLKAFPAERLGPEWFTHLLGPFPDVQFAATGGMTLDSVAKFVAAGCRVVAVGSAFEDEAQIARVRSLTTGQR